MEQKYDYKNLKDLDYQEGDEDEESPEWVRVVKSGFNKIRSIIYRSISDGLKTKVDEDLIT